MTTASAVPPNQRPADSIISTPPLDWSSVEFFPEPERLACLNILFHLSPYTNVPLVVLGERGSGRSTLLAQLSAKSEDNWRVITANGAAGLRAPEFCAQVAHAFGLAAFGGEGGTAWIPGMLAHFRHLAKAGQRPLLLVDDADLLPPDVLELLIALTQEIRRNDEAGCLVFTALPGFCHSTALRALRELGGHVFELPPFDEENSRKLVAHQLKRRGLPPDRLDDRALNALLRRARGSVAELVAFVERLAAAAARPPAAASTPPAQPAADAPPPVQQVRAPPSPPATKSKKRRSVGPSLAAAVVTSALAAALIFQDRINELITPQRHNAGATRKQAEAPTVPATGVATIVQAPGDADLPGVAPEMDSSVPPAGLEPTRPAGDVTDPPMTPGSLVESEPEDIGRPFVESMLVADLENPAPTEFELTPDIVQSPPTPETEPHFVEPTPIAPVSEPAQAAPVAAHPDAPAPTSESRPVPAAEPPTDVSDPMPVTPSLQAKAPEILGDDWYLNQSNEHFTIQVMALRSDDELRKIANRIVNGGPLAIYRFKRKSGPMFAMTYGFYTSREAAQDAAKQLPKALGRVEPWVRKFKLIQQEIRQAQTP